ncbi:MAG: cupin domain-containing protein [Acidobacteriota bacterium]
MNHTNRFLIAVTATILAAVAAVGQSVTTPKHRIIPIRPMTGDVEILYGDPDKVGEPFVIRIRELAGGMIPPHRHPVDEHITVVQGTVYFAVGDEFDRAVLREMKAGSYAFIPKGSVMFGYTPDAAIVQVHGIGPFHIDWRSASGWRSDLKTLDSPDAAAIFKFKRGERVVTVRGAGRIRQAYDSGEVIGYEIDGEDGTLFIAEECEIRDANGKSHNDGANGSSKKCFSKGTGPRSARLKDKHAEHRE